MEKRWCFPLIGINEGIEELTLTLLIGIRAVRYDDIYRMDEIKSLSFHILLYRLFRVSQNTLFTVILFSSFG